MGALNDTPFYQAVRFAKSDLKGHRDPLTREPAVNHSLRVARNVTTDDARLVAAVHDTTAAASPYADLLLEFLPENLRESVSILNRDDGPDSDDYVSAVRNNPAALEVQLAALDDYASDQYLRGLAVQNQSSYRQHIESLRNLYS